MTISVFIDSSAWLSYVIVPDSNHGRASDIFHSFTFQTKLFTSTFILDETVSKLRKVLDQKRSYKFYLDLKQLVVKKRLVIYDVVYKDVEKAILLLNQYPTPNTFSLTDATNIALCQKYRVTTLFSFDSDFKKLHLPKLRVIPE